MSFDSNIQPLKIWVTTFGTTARARQVASEPGGIGTDPVELETDWAEKDIRRRGLQELCRETVEQDGHFLGTIFSVKKEDLRAMKKSVRGEMLERFGEEVFEEGRARRLWPQNK